MVGYYRESLAEYKLQYADIAETYAGCFASAEVDEVQDAEALRRIDESTKTILL